MYMYTNLCAMTSYPYTNYDLLPVYIFKYIYKYECIHIYVGSKAAPDPHGYSHGGIPISNNDIQQVAIYFNFLYNFIQ
jgi:hypothetical protein